MAEIQYSGTVDIANRLSNLTMELVSAQNMRDPDSVFRKAMAIPYPYIYKAKNYSSQPWEFDWPIAVKVALSNRTIYSESEICNTAKSLNKLVQDLLLKDSEAEIIITKPLPMCVPNIVCWLSNKRFDVINLQTNACLSAATNLSGFLKAMGLLESFAYKCVVYDNMLIIDNVIDLDDLRLFNVRKDIDRMNKDKDYVDKVIESYFNNKGHVQSYYPLYLFGKKDDLNIDPKLFGKLLAANHLGNCYAPTAEESMKLALTDKISRKDFLALMFYSTGSFKTIQMTMDSLHTLAMALET